MRVSLMAFALAALVSGAPAENHDLTTAILVQPIHDAQVVHADDGNDHVDYELLVVNAFAAPVTLSSVIVLDPSGKELGHHNGLLPAHPAVVSSILHFGAARGSGAIGALCSRRFRSSATTVLRHC